MDAHIPASIPAFEALVTEHGREIYNYLWRLLQNHQDVDDVFQDTYLRAFRAFPRLRANSNTRAWLYQIATNSARTTLKQRNRQRDRDLELTDWIASAAAQPSRIDEHMDLRQALQSLPEKQRLSLVLRYYQGLDYSQIGEILNCSPQAARANLSQAVRKLRRSFTDEEPK